MYMEWKNGKWELYWAYLIDNRRGDFGGRFHSRHSTEQECEWAAREEMGIAEWCAWYDDPNYQEPLELEEAA